MIDLWRESSKRSWLAALEAYGSVIDRQDSARLAELDRWYHDELGPTLRKRAPKHLTGEELARLTEWKMARGVWRARNLVLVRGNENDLVVETSARGLARIPDPRAPIAALAELSGVGPATASAVAAAAEPSVYPFFDELVAAQIPGLGAVAFTIPYYLRYAEAIRERARELGADWTPASVEQALWSNSGGKAGPG